MVCSDVTDANCHIHEALCHVCGVFTVMYLVYCQHDGVLFQFLSHVYVVIRHVYDDICLAWAALYIVISLMFSVACMMLFVIRMRVSVMCVYYLSFIWFLCDAYGILFQYVCHV